ncbi:TetR/AcrR family transcriptional regulator C-terminal domain-containing protein, partial [Nocardia jiangxiensis]
ARFPLTAQALPTVLATPAEERFELGIRLMLSGIPPKGTTTPPT